MSVLREVLVDRFMRKYNAGKNSILQLGDAGVVKVQAIHDLVVIVAGRGALIA